MATLGAIGVKLVVFSVAGYQQDLGVAIRPLLINRRLCLRNSTLLRSSREGISCQLSVHVTISFLWTSARRYSVWPAWECSCRADHDVDEIYSCPTSPNAAVLLISISAEECPSRE